MSRSTCCTSGIVAEICDAVLKSGSMGTKARARATRVQRPSCQLLASSKWQLILQGALSLHFKSVANLFLLALSFLACMVFFESSTAS